MYDIFIGMSYNFKHIFRTWLAEKLEKQGKG